MWDLDREASPLSHGRRAPTVHRLPDGLPTWSLDCSGKAGRPWAPSYVLLWGPTNAPHTARQREATDLQPRPIWGSPFSASLLPLSSRCLLEMGHGLWRELWACGYETRKASMLLPASVLAL